MKKFVCIAFMVYFGKQGRYMHHGNFSWGFVIGYGVSSHQTTCKQGSFQTGHGRTSLWRQTWLVNLQCDTLLKIPSWSVRYNAYSACRTASRSHARKLYTNQVSSRCIWHTLLFYNLCSLQQCWDSVLSRPRQCIQRHFRLKFSWYSYLFIWLDRPWGFQEIEAPIFQDSWQMTVVRLSSLRTKIFLIHICVTDWIDPRAMMRPEACGQWKIPIEPATFRLVAQCLNQLRYRLPQKLTHTWKHPAWLRARLVSTAEHLKLSEVLAKDNHVHQNRRGWM